jgi:hypothetical protein
MQTVDETRDEILAELQRKKGLAFPDTGIVPGHPLHWHPDHPKGSLTGQLSAYLGAPLFAGRTVDAAAFEALSELAERLSKPDRPSFLARQMGLECSEILPARAVDSNGAIPSARDGVDGVTPQSGAGPLLAETLEKAAGELAHCAGRVGPQTAEVVRELVRLLTWSFWSCPDTAVDLLLETLRGRTALPVQSVGGEQ